MIFRFPGLLGWSLLFTLSLSLSLSAQETKEAVFGVDHAPPTEKHVQHTEEFIAKHIKTDGKFDEEKVKAFIERLQKEKEILGKDLYETEMMEKLEFEVGENYEKVKKSALKEMDEKKSELLQGYSLYMIPKMEALLKSLQEKGEAETAVQEGLLDDFFRLYHVYYIPNYQRRMFYNDYDWPTMFKHAVKGFTFARKSDRIEANNLMVEESNRKEISDCLGTALPAGHYLRNGEIARLENECRMDLSRLNPGISSIWKKIKKDDRLKLRETYEKLFPKSEEKIIFKRVRLSGAGSPKMSAYFERNGKKFDLKVKVGQEVHSEIITAYLSRFMGLNMDLMAHRPFVKVYLGNVSYQEFVAHLTQKYGAASVTNYVHSHGGNPGDEWVGFQDVLLEIDDPDVIRLEAYDPDGWDFNNRREHRSQILWFGWLDILDTKSGNYKGLLRKTKQGLVPEFRLQDVGASLGRSAHLRNKSALLRELKSYGANFFDPTFMEWGQDTVHIWWNDFVNLKGRFQTTTYSDLKWMARQIAQITEEEIYYALKISGTPQEIHELYKHKISARRNEIVKAFDLEEEFPLFAVPDLNTFSPNQYVRNGKVTVTHFDGHNDIEISRTNFFTLLAGFLTFNVPLDNVTKDFDLKLAEATRVTVTPNISEMINDSIKPVFMKYVFPGIGLTLGRNVGVNTHWFNNADGNHGFFVKDTLGIEININSEFLTTVQSFLNFKIAGNVQVYRKEIQFTQYADSFVNAWKTPFRLLNVIFNFNNYVTNGLRPGEVIRVLDGYGFDIKASVTPPSPYNLAPLINNEAGISAYWHYVSPVYFARDSFGELQIYKERSNTFGAGLFATIGEVNLLFDKLPLLGIEFTFNAFFQESQLYSFKLPAYSIDTNAMENVKRQRDLEALNTFMKRNGDKTLEAKMRLDMHLKAKGYSYETHLGFLYLWKRDWKKGYSTADITLGNGEKRKFYRYYADNAKSFGGPRNVPFHGDIFLHDYKKNHLAIEMDGSSPEDFVVIARGQSYYRKKTKLGVENLIADLNDLYSESQEKPFYRDFALPDADEINDYKKIYAESYVYVDGKGIMEKILVMKEQDLRKTAEKFFRENVPYRRFAPLTRMITPMERGIKLNTLMDAFRKLKRIKNNIKNQPRAFVSTMGKFMEALNVSEHGVDLLKQLLGPDHMFVMGQIYGVYRSFTTLNVLEPEATRRFAGKHWGTHLIPPVRKFLRNNNVLPIGFYLDSDIQTAEIFGVLPMSVAPVR